MNCYLVLYRVPKYHTLTHKYNQSNVEKSNYAYINLNIKCSTPPHIDTYIGRTIHVSGLLISLSGPANSLKRLHVQKRNHVQNISFDTTARNKQHVRVVQWRVTIYTR